MTSSPASPSTSRILVESNFSRLVKGRYGYVLYNKNDIVIGRFMETCGEYFESEVAVFRQICRPGDIVIDAGANIGTHTLALAHLVGPTGAVIAFEPQRLVFEMLCANAALNGIPNIMCHHAALGAEPGSASLADVHPRMPQNFGGVSLGNMPGNIKIPILTLDTINPPPRLRLIKIDVEGMEREVLEGGVKLIEQHRPVLYIENDRPEKSEALIQFLRSRGYRPYWHLPDDFNSENFFGHRERLFAQGFIETSGEFLGSVGFAINLLCFHESHQANLTDFREVADSHEHPLKREYNHLFTGTKPAV